MSSRQPSHFLLSRQKKVTKEKATPLRVTLRFATGNLRCSLQAGSAQTRFAQTRAALNPPEAARLGTRRGECECECQCQCECQCECECECECEHERGPGAHVNLHSTEGRAMARWSSNP